MASRASLRAASVSNNSCSLCTLLLSSHCWVSRLFSESLWSSFIFSEAACFERSCSASVRLRFAPAPLGLVRALHDLHSIPLVQPRLHLLVDGPGAVVHVENLHLRVVVFQHDAYSLCLHPFCSPYDYIKGYRHIPQIPSFDPSLLQPICAHALSIHTSLFFKHSW